MNVHDDAGPGMDEKYWQAILSQGEVSAGDHIVSGSTELWEGLPRYVEDSASVDDIVHESQEGDSDNCWARAQRCLETGEVLELEVTGYNRGGVLVSWDRLHGFVPASHLLGFSSYLDEEKRRSELACRVGTCLKLKIIELNPEGERFILSERMTTDEEQHRAELLAEIQPGDVRQGHVTNLCSFGAFVDLGGVEGLIHISELSWGRIDHPRDVLEIGQLVDVYVLNTNPAEGRVGLSLKRLLPDPWETVDERYEHNQLVEGIITNVVNFGAFARLEEGLEGLIHVSELAEGNFLHPRNVVKEGEKVIARVLSIDSQQRRIALSLRQVKQAELVEQEAEVEAWATSSTPAPVGGYRS
jgi:small subunit ribosomal protein S1